MLHEPQPATRMTTETPERMTCQPLLCCLSGEPCTNACWGSLAAGGYLLVSKLWCILWSCLCLSLLSCHSPSVFSKERRETWLSCRNEHGMECSASASTEEWKAGRESSTCSTLWIAKPLLPFSLTAQPCFSSLLWILNTPLGTV